MDTKWFWIALIVLYAMLGITFIVKENGKDQCRIAAIQRGLNASDINEICK